MRSLPQPRESKKRRLKRMFYAVLQYSRKGYIEDGSAFEIFSHRASNDGSKTFQKMVASMFGVFNMSNRFMNSRSSSNITTDGGRNLAGKITGVNKQGRRRKVFRSSSKRVLRRGIIKVPYQNNSLQINQNNNNENETSKKKKKIPNSKTKNSTLDGNGSITDESILNEETASISMNNSITTMLTSLWSSKTQQSRNEISSFEYSNSTIINDDLQKKKDIIPQEVYASLEPNKLYSETIDLNTFELDKKSIRSTNYKSTTNVVVPDFEESLKFNSWSTYLASFITPIADKFLWNVSTGNNHQAKQKSQKSEYKEPLNNANNEAHKSPSENNWFEPLLRNKEPNTKFRKVLIIGVHGFFPTKILRPLLGEPTGTSFKFMLEAENTIKHWIFDNKHKFQTGKDKEKIQISKIALVKSDKVFNRVNCFIDVIKYQIPDLNSYDFIYVAAHSQGTPVSVMLMAQLIKKEILKLSFDKTIGILAMAGISNGPFYEMKNIYLVKAYSALESESLSELFEFQDFSTLQSSTYKKSLKLLLSNNVKIVYVGSIDDQLVPLYSSTCLSVNHPNVFRAIYIDTNSNTPNFLLRILSCALLLRNKGVNDHGIIKEMSNALAGPLTGGGHSRLYNEYKVYELGLKFFLNTTNVESVDGKGLIPSFTDFDVSKLGTNKYYLPWCLREFMYSTCSYIPDGKTHVKLMMQEFDEWNPEKKILKEIKQRMIPMKP